MKFTFIIFVFFITSLIASNFASAQINSNDQPYVVESKSSGEISSWKTDTMRSEMNGERLFIIVRLGKGETNHQINQIRLAKTKWFMLNKGFNQQTSVFAEGERVEGEGRIEFYTGSHLRLIILAQRNKMPNFTCCEDYFPPKKRKPNKRKG